MGYLHRQILFTKSKVNSVFTRRSSVKTELLRVFFSLFSKEHHIIQPMLSFSLLISREAIFKVPNQPVHSLIRMQQYFEEDSS